MGWIRGLVPAKLAFQRPQDIAEGQVEAKRNVNHGEDIGSTTKDQSCAQQRDSSLSSNEYPIQRMTVPHEELPFIPPETVISKRRPGALSGKTNDIKGFKDYWIVVDEVVYDCSEFIAEHPGGEQVILSFVGEDCSWQFWRFHGKNEMEQYAKVLRIGRTRGIVNRFVEPVRFVGLSKFGNDDG